MSLAARLEAPPAPNTWCRVCAILRDLAENKPEEHEAAVRMLYSWAHTAIADAFTAEGYAVSETAVRRHRKKGHGE